MPASEETSHPRWFRHANVSHTLDRDVPGHFAQQQSTKVEIIEKARRKGRNRRSEMEQYIHLITRTFGGNGANSAHYLKGIHLVEREQVILWVLS